MCAASPGIDPRSGRPIPPDYVVAQTDVPYTPEHHAIWSQLYERQEHLLRGRVVDEFLVGLHRLGMTSRRIPDFAELNERLHAATGWRVVAVPGLVPDDVFFTHLAAQRFPAGYWIRGADELDYIEEPDVFHDVFGHVPLLMHQDYADYMRAYGLAGLRLAQSPALSRLARLYWYTVEFGLMNTPRGLRIFGAGIASSHEEVLHSLQGEAAIRRPFDLVTVLRTRYEIDHLQTLYFVLDGFAQLPSLSSAQLAEPLQTALQQTDLRPPSARAFDAVNVESPSSRAF
jgi:phenylalanine-4-hydroxylase